MSVMRQLGSRLRCSCAIFCAVASAVLLSACANPPTSPSPGVLPPAFITVACPSELLVGQSAGCFATAQFLSGGSAVLFDDAEWSSSDPTVASAAILGLIKGRSAGQVTISVLYRGVQGSAQVPVRHQDVLRCANTAPTQGEFRTGMTVTRFAQGFYGVQSAGSGELSLQITDQNGDIVSTSTPTIVPWGGDSFVLSNTFTIPVGATQVCMTAILQIGTATLVATPPEILRCIPIKP